MKAKYKLILGRRKQYPLNIELEVYKGVDCRVFVSTGITLDNENQWDPFRQLILRNKNAAAYNDYLKRLVVHIERAELDAEKRGIAFTKDSVRNAARSMSNEKQENLFELISKYINEDRALRDSTRYTHLSYIKNIQKFVDNLKNESKSPLYFEEVNLEFIKGFHKFLSKTKSQASSANIHFTLRKYIAKAKKDGFLEYNPYDDFEIHEGTKAKKPSLTTADIAAIEALTEEQLNALGKNCVVLRDRFLFSCYTGLRISDNINLRKSNIHKNKNGLTLQMKTKKTEETVTLPLFLLFNGKPQEIAQRYMSQKRDDDYLFPFSTGVTSKLKSIFKLANVSENFTFHSARHTCATILAEKANDPFVVKCVLGHESITSSMGYVNNSVKTAEKKLAAIKWDEDTQHGILLGETYSKVISLCKSKNLPSTVTFLVIGGLTSQPAKAPMVETWLQNTDFATLATEDIYNRIHSLINL